MRKLCVLVFTITALAGCSSKTSECGFFVLDKDRANCERVNSAEGRSF